MINMWNHFNKKKNDFKKTVWLLENTARLTAVPEVTFIHYQRINVHCVGQWSLMSAAHCNHLGIFKHTAAALTWTLWLYWSQCDLAVGVCKLLGDAWVQTIEWIHNWSRLKCRLGSWEHLEKKKVVWPVWLSGLGVVPLTTKVIGSVPYWGTCLGCGFDPRSGYIWEATDWCFSHQCFSPFLLPPFPSLSQ